MAEDDGKRDVPDTLWVGVGKRDSPITKDIPLLRQKFTEWMAPNKFEILEINFWPAFAWGTIRMKSAKQRNYLIELAKQKPFRPEGSDVWIINKFAVGPHGTPAKKKNKDKSASDLYKAATANPTGAKAKTEKPKKGNVAENIIKTSRSKSRASSVSTNRSGTASPAGGQAMSNRAKKRLEKQLLHHQKQQLMREQKTFARNSPQKSNGFNPFQFYSTDEPLMYHQSDDDEEDLIREADRELSFADRDRLFRSISVNHSQDDDFDGFAYDYKNDLDDVSNSESDLPTMLFKQNPALTQSATNLASNQMSNEPFQKSDPSPLAKGDNFDLTQFTGGVKSRKGRIVSHSPRNKKPLEVVYYSDGVTPANIMIGPSDIKNLVEGRDLEPRILVGEEVMLHMTGQRNEIFLFAELLKTWDRTGSEAIGKAISVLMSFYEYSGRDSSSSGGDFIKLIEEIRTAESSKDISNLVRDELSTAASRFKKKSQPSDEDMTTNPDSHEIFVGNIPHDVSDSDLKLFFGRFGQVVDVRLHSKSGIKSNGNEQKPNFAFVVFKDVKSVQECLARKPIHLTNGHRLNIEVKKPKPETITAKSNHRVVEVINSDLSDDEAESLIEDEPLDFGSDLLMPLPTVQPGDYEEAFVLPVEDETEAISNIEEEMSNIDLSIAQSQDFWGRMSPTSVRDLTDCNELIAWLAVNYFGQTLAWDEAESNAKFIAKKLLATKASVEFYKQLFNGGLQKKLTLEHVMREFAVEIRLRSPNANETIWNWSQVLVAYFVSKNFPASCMPSTVRCLLRTISFRAFISNPHSLDHFQTLGVISCVFQDFGVIASAIGHVIFNVALLNNVRKEDLHGLLVLFDCKQDPKSDVSNPSFVATRVEPFFPGTISAIKPSSTNGQTKKSSDELSFEMSSHSHLSPSQLFEETFAELNSKPSNKRISAESFLVDLAVLQTYQELEIHFEKTLAQNGDSATISKSKAKLYVSMWARLGFTSANLFEDHQHLKSLGGLSCVFNNWLALLYQVQLPKIVSPVFLVKTTSEFFDLQKPSVNATTDFALNLWQMSYYRGTIDDLLCGLSGHSKLPRPIILPPFSSITDAGSAPHQEPFYHHDFQPSKSASDRPSSVTNHMFKVPTPTKGCVTVQSTNGEMNLFALNEDGNLSCESVNALYPQTVALKYRHDDQIWRIISKTGAVFPQPLEGWSDKLYTIAQGI